MTLELIDEAVAAGAPQFEAAKVLGVSSRTLARWKQVGGGEDLRAGPHSTPAHRLTDAERQRVVETANRPEFRNLSPKQIVPLLADAGFYIASESSFYRILREQGLLAHRQHARPARAHKPREHVATGPGQVWTWDITYLRSPVRGAFFYLYLVVDVWSRKVVAAEVHAEESMALGAALIESACAVEGIDPKKLVLHADNGGPMKGSTMLATLQRLGVVASFSRPQVSDDNPYVEALFRTLKYRPGYPRRPFASLEQARQWVAGFVRWYNTEHLHSGIRFVTPDDRHHGRDVTLLAARRTVYATAKARAPRRWSGAARNWTPVGSVYLNPVRASVEAAAAIH